MDRWTQAKMRDLAEEERASLGLAEFDPLEPRDLATAYGIPIYCLEDLASDAPDAVAHFSEAASRRWSAALIAIGPCRLIIENDAHAAVRRRSSIGHEVAHHLLEHPFETMILAEDKCRRFDAQREKEATFLSGHLLVPHGAAKRAAFDEWSNTRVADTFGVSPQFAQMRMSGLRVFAERALKKQASRGR